MRGLGGPAEEEGSIMPVPRLSLIVPAYNEAKTILATLDAMRAYLDRQPYGYEILVAADGTDGTRTLAGGWAAGDPRVQVFGSPERGGKGRGIRQGVARARGQILGFLDADYKVTVEEVERLLP